MAYLHRIGSALTGKGERTMTDRGTVIGGLEQMLIHYNEMLKLDGATKNHVLLYHKAMVEDALALLKEQEADIIAMSRFLESHGWDSDSICGKNVEIVVTNGDDVDA